MRRAEISARRIRWDFLSDLFFFCLFVVVCLTDRAFSLYRSLDFRQGEDKEYADDYHHYRPELRRRKQVEEFTSVVAAQKFYQKSENSVSDTVYTHIEIAFSVDLERKIT